MIFNRRHRIRPLLIGVLILAVGVMGNSSGAVMKAQQVQLSNYELALCDAVGFYDANKCGADAGEKNVFAWRGACHVTDGQDVGLDLTGGYHDCGDHVKFGITQGYTASVLGWSYAAYKDSFVQVEIGEKTLETLKHFTDYFLKCHPNPSVYYYQIGDGGTDHAYWGAPEKQGSRQVVYKVDSEHPGSDVVGEASAALSLMYLNYQGIDKAYAEQCLVAARSLYNLGTLNLGVSQAQGFYQSSSYKDDLAWAAIWLYEATGEERYLEEAKVWHQIDGGIYWTMCWDNMYLPTAIKLYEHTKNASYLNQLRANIQYWQQGVQTTKGGLKYLTNWGVLRYAAAEAFIAMQYYTLSGDESAKSLAISQIDYILGNNPANRSYLIEYGTSYPLYPHHRAANGYTYENGDNLKKAKHTLTGALVGGPNEKDQYLDSGSNYVYTEVGIDYNAGLVGVLAALVNEGDNRKG